MMRRVTATKWFKILKLSVLVLLPFSLLFFSLDVLETKPTICLFKNIFGVECWGCGITKAVIAVVQCQFVRAFHYNKLVVIVFPLLVYAWIREIVRTVRAMKKEKKN